ncbi:polymer-forming cytoskeletal protein [Kordia sp. YSTF-M3]|uniref:Polymer-forming cytoskeletal protein n=1 Tax=Kordia aestuariivivens TaxID=2759037 RepID=A0ABR7Q9R3_9FLAO|nr:polymer-forming cytoskeletal protein [Kordia aestuariivivens]MBC8755306.1 polymer-forming cytoskeletal protein [Kordia aestuariivivens]
MFSESKKRNSESTRGQSNRIGKSTNIKGDVVSEADFRIDGTLEGSVETSGKIVIGTSGVITGKVICANADIEGRFEGELIVSNLLTLKSTAVIEGNVTVSKLSIEPGATFNATCAMKTGVKELKSSEGKKTDRTA